MTTRNHFVLWVAVVVAICGAMARGNAQEPTTVPRASSVVRPQAYVSLEPVPRGKEFQVAVVAEIARGFHMNSNHPSDAYLIPTTLTPQLPTGFKLLDTIYPEGQNQKFSFSPDKPLNVYSGSVTIKLRVLAETDATMGAISIPMTLRYQACNDSTCLPPVKLPVEAKIAVSGADTKAQAAHPEIFLAKSPK